jgi:hypothetical protein
MTDRALHGEHATIIAYGVSGSGKNHTICSKDGLLQQSVERLFSAIDSERLSVFGF